MMEQFMAFTGRNLKNYFRDKGAVFFSLLSMLIVILLMVFFLGDMYAQNIASILGDFPGRDAAADRQNAELLILSWNFAGIISINAVTVTMAVYSVMIRDRVMGKLSSIYTAPVSRGIITGGYIAAAWMASVSVCAITLFITEICGIIKGMEAFSLITHMKLLGLIGVNSFVYAALMYLVAVAAKTQGAWSSLGTVVGTLVGFLGGIYVPIGSLAPTIVTIIKCTPVIYGTSMFRIVMTEGIAETTFSGVPEEVLEAFCIETGIHLEVFDRPIGITEEWLGLFACGVLLLIAGIMALKFGRKADR